MHIDVSKASLKLSMERYLLHSQENSRRLVPQQEFFCKQFTELYVRQWYGV